MQIYKYHAVASTQDLAKEYLKKGHRKAAFIAKTQTSGYGKRGRIFYSPAFKGIYLSIAIPSFKLDSAHSGLLTLAIGVKVVHVLQALVPQNALQLKWVNDIYLKGKKIAGILAEKTKDGLVIGLGVNIAPYSFPKEIADQVGSLNLENFDFDQISKNLVQAIKQATELYLDPAFLMEYRTRSYLTNQEVTLKIGHASVTGTVIDIDDQGRIVIASSQKIKAYSSGEVTKVNMKSH